MIHRDVVVVVPGEETTCFDGARELTEPTAVVLDRRGRVRSIGSQEGETVVPFSSTDVYDVGLACAYLERLLAGFPARHPLAVILTPAGGHAGVEGWELVACRLRLPGVLVSRPMAAAVGLGLEVDSEGGMLVVEVSAGVTTAAVVADGTVVVSVSGRGTDPGEVAASIRSVLVSIDPDLEWDVRQEGVHLLGEFPGGSWVTDLAGRLHLPVLPGGGLRVLLEGALATVEVIRPYLWDAAATRAHRRPGLLRTLK